MIRSNEKHYYLFKFMRKNWRKHPFHPDDQQTNEPSLILISLSSTEELHTSYDTQEDVFIGYAHDTSKTLLLIDLISRQPFLLHSSNSKEHRWLIFKQYYQGKHLTRGSNNI